ncbi:MAG: hypothetical protein ACRDFB_01695 [Rhabdochlamydiaceae bacterium]
MKSVIQWLKGLDMDIWLFLSMAFGGVAQIGMFALLFLTFFIDSDFVKKKRLKKPTGDAVPLTFFVIGSSLTASMIFLTVSLVFAVGALV